MSKLGGGSIRYTWPRRRLAPRLLQEVLKAEERDLDTEVHGNCGGRTADVVHQATAWGATRTVACGDCLLQSCTTRPQARGDAARDREGGRRYF